MSLFSIRYMMNMNRRRYVTAVAAVGVGATAGCLEQLEAALEGDADASGTIRRGNPETFAFDASEGDEIQVRATVTDNASGREGEVTLYDPDGSQVDSTTFVMAQTNTMEFTAVADGTHEVEVDPRDDRRVQLRIEITVESDE